MMTDKTDIIKIAVVEDDDTVRNGLQMLLDGTPGISFLAAYDNGEDALANLPELKPDVVLMDINLPGISGIECIYALKELNLSMNFIMLTVFEDSDAIFKSLSAGASGYLLKHTPPGKLLEAIQEVYKGGSPMSSEIARKVVDSFQPVATLPNVSYGLTKRENEILSFLAKGYLYKEIASSLFISLGHANSEIKKLINRTHPLGVTLCQIFIHGDDMNAIVTYCIEIGRQGGNKCLTFTGAHLGNIAIVKNHATDELHIEGTHAQGTYARFPGDGKGFRQQVHEGSAV